MLGSPSEIKSSLKVRSLLLSLIICGSGILLASPATAAPVAGNSQELLAKITQIEQDLSKFQETQNQMLQKQDKILEELDRLRIWVRRN